MSTNSNNQETAMSTETTITREVVIQGVLELILDNEEVNKGADAYASKTVPNPDRDHCSCDEEDTYYMLYSLYIQKVIITACTRTWMHTDWGVCDYIDDALLEHVLNVVEEHDDLTLWCHGEAEGNADADRLAPEGSIEHTHYWAIYEEEWLSILLTVASRVTRPVA